MCNQPVWPSWKASGVTETQVSGPTVVELDTSWLPPGERHAAVVDFVNREVIRNRVVHPEPVASRWSAGSRSMAARLNRFCRPYRGKTSPACHSAAEIDGPAEKVPCRLGMTLLPIGIGAFRNGRPRWA